MQKPQLLRPTRPGLIVRHPTFGQLPPEGAEVVMDSFWSRRLRDRSVEVVQPSPEAPRATPATTKKRGRSRPQE